MARWALVAVAAGLVLAELKWPGLWGGYAAPSWWVPLGVIAVWGGVNIYAARGARAESSVARPVQTGVYLLLDVALLTAVLALIGGASNPFTILYFLPITLATLVSRSWTWWVALFAVLGFAVLVGVSTWTMGVGAQEDHCGHAEHAAAHDHDDHFWRHLVGMGVALAVAGSLVTYFVHKVAGVLTVQRNELERLRREAREDRYVASLGALSAGAAHELGTPLGTIQLLAGELELMCEEERQEAVRSIREALDRCKDILHGMKNPELSARALEAEGPWKIERLVSELQRIEIPDDVAWTVHVESAMSLVYQPRSVIEQTIRELITNALRARVADKPLAIDVTFAVSSEDLAVSVRDTGSGMTAEEASLAFEPFFSTRREGRGLGLFLARLHVRQLGGTLRLESVLGEGTLVVMRVPSHFPGVRRPRGASEQETLPAMGEGEPEP